MDGGVTVSSVSAEERPGGESFSLQSLLNSEDDLTSNGTTSSAIDRADTAFALPYSHACSKYETWELSSNAYSHACSKYETRELSSNAYSHACSKYETWELSSKIPSTAFAPPADTSCHGRLELKG